jgi:hypothetical protein
MGAGGSVMEPLVLFGQDARPGMKSASPLDPALVAAARELVGELEELLDMGVVCLAFDARRDLRLTLIGELMSREPLEWLANLSQDAPG